MVGMAWRVVGRTTINMSYGPQLAEIIPPWSHSGTMGFDRSAVPVSDPQIPSFAEALSWRNAFAALMEKERKPGIRSTMPGVDSASTWTVAGTYDRNILNSDQNDATLPHGLRSNILRHPSLVDEADAKEGTTAALTGKTAAGGTSLCGESPGRSRRPERRT